ncbi:MAG: DUF302 domain-containing protein [Gammaproteobacteria bacterium]|nr:DUF302 domain-containing protein [Gammaproteobacteria bacterium]MBT7308178.1 DUF302 domain-containing protein [Gammaproteobacteria bacterium]
MIKITRLLLLFSLFTATADAIEPPAQEMQVTHSVIKMRLAPSVTIQDAAEAMLSKAANLNLALVGRQHPSKALQNRGIDSPHIEIFQFCNPEDAAKMVRHDIIYAAYMPCRIALVEDNHGMVWLTTLNLNMMIAKSDLPDEIYRIAVSTNTKIMTIMTAGANGDF